MGAPGSVSLNQPCLVHKYGRSGSVVREGATLPPQHSFALGHRDATPLLTCRMRRRPAARWRATPHFSRLL